MSETTFTMPMIYITVLASVMALFAIFSQIRVTRRFAMILFILEGLAVLGGGFYLFFGEEYRNISYVMLAAGLIYVIIGFIMFKILARTSRRAGELSRSNAQTVIEHEE